VSIADRVAARVAERLTILSGPEVRQAAARLVAKLPDDSFETIIAKAYFRAIMDGEEYRAKHLAKSVMVSEEVEALKKQLASEIKSKALAGEGIE
jgi:hypothetical protein